MAARAVILNFDIILDFGATAILNLKQYGGYARQFEFLEIRRRLAR